MRIQIALQKSCNKQSKIKEYIPVAHLIYLLVFLTEISNLIQSKSDCWFYSFLIIFWNQFLCHLSKIRKWYHNSPKGWKQKPSSHFHSSFSLTLNTSNPCLVYIIYKTYTKLLTFFSALLLSLKPISLFARITSVVSKTDLRSKVITYEMQITLFHFPA